MSLTFIKTNDCARQSVAGAGTSAEILNDALCGAKNVLAKLHWLKGNDTLLQLGLESAPEWGVGGLRV